MVPLLTRTFSAITLASLASYVLATQSMCSTQNTGVTTSSSSFMSNGLCSNTCSGYALAIVQGTNCWCSNTAPGSTTSVSDCSVDCPGYPAEQCGNESEGLYGYIELKEPSSTADSASSTSQSQSSSASTQSSSLSAASSVVSSSSVTSSSTTTSSSIESSSTESSSTESSAITSSSAASSSTTSSSTTSSSTTKSSSATSSSTTKSSSATSSKSTSSVAPITSIVYSIMTITGSAETQLTTTQVISTVISVPTSSSTGTTNKSSSGFFHSPGKVAGTFVAVGIIVLAIISALLWFCCLHKNREDEDEDEESAHSGSHNQDEKRATVPTSLNPDGYQIGDDDFVEVDQRLDPRQMFMNWENGSRKSLADELDYSRRVLRVTND